MAPLPEAGNRSESYWLQSLQALQALPDSAVYCVDQDLRLVGAGGGALSAICDDPNNLLGKMLAQVLPPSVYVVCEGPVRAALGGHAASFEVDYPNGASFHTWTAPLAGGVTANQALMVAFDVTQRKHAEAELRRSEAALKLSQAVSRVGHWTWDIPTNSVSLSDELRRIYALDETDRNGDINEMLARIVHPDDLARVQAHQLAVMREQNPVGAEYRIVWPDGSIHHVWAMPGQRMFDATGKIVQLTGVIQDITERKLSEESQARQARLAALGQLSAGIAHDFNNILAVITIYAEMTLETAILKESERARLEIIVEQAMRATNMIRQILDFSRQSLLERSPLDLLPLLKEQLKLLHQMMPESIEIELKYAPGDYVVLGDPARIQQLIVNLVVNARDAMPTGGKLRLELAHQSVADDLPAPIPAMEAGRWVRLAVTDTGTGIAVTDLDNIFEPFFTTKQPSSGTGLGLAQVRGIVAQHEGHITVSTEQGHGTTFDVYLPELSAGATPADGKPAQVLLPHGQGQSVLLVEDEEALRLSLAELMGLWNYRVVQAANGEEALALLAGAATPPAQPIDLIVTDAVMPKMGGVELIATLRRHNIDIPVILISGYMQVQEHSDFSGVYARLDKPLDSKKLARAMAGAGNRLPGDD